MKPGLQLHPNLVLIAMGSSFWLALPSAPLLGQGQKTVFLPNYIPTDPNTYCKRTLRWTFGQTGEFSSEILGPVTVPCKSGSICQETIEPWDSRSPFCAHLRISSRMTKQPGFARLPQETWTPSTKRSP